MRHYSCALCGDSIHDDHFVVKVEVFAAFDQDELNEANFETDQLALVTEEVAAIESGQAEAPRDLGSKRMRFDLCEGCRSRYLDDPLGRDALGRVNYSEN